MTMKPEILEAALEALRRGDSLTLDAVAREAGLTKPGVVHHFPTKEVLTMSVVEHLLDRWDEALQIRAGNNPSPIDRLRAYVEFTLLGDMDAADLALLAVPNLRDKLSALWVERMDVWFGDIRDPRLVVARLVADGAWIDRCLGLLPLDEDERMAAVALVNSLITEGINS